MRQALLRGKRLSLSPWRRLLFLEFTGKGGGKTRKILQWDGYLGFSAGRDVTDFSEK